MNDYLISILLGIVEGLTEFLPVSSTAHLRITQALLGVNLESGYWKMYTVVIQLGAILSVVLYFRKRLIEFAKTFPRGKDGDKTVFTHPLTLVMIAFFVTAIPAFLLSGLIKDNLESLRIMGLSLLIGGVIMWVVDRWASGREQPVSAIEKMTLPQAAIIGAAQILSAVFPGTSRSMSTIASGQLVGMTRPAALEFSFFLSIPIMFAACLYDLYKSLRATPGEAAYIAEPMDAHHWIVLAIGFVVSFIVALACVHWFMGWVRKRGFVPFAIYRIILGIGILVWAMI